MEVWKGRNKKRRAGKKMKNKLINELIKYCLRNDKKKEGSKKKSF